MTTPEQCPWSEDKICWECRTGTRIAEYLYPKPHRVIFDVAECFHEQRFRVLYRRSGLTPADTNRTFENAVRDQYNREVISALENWTGPEGIYIYSPPTKGNPGGNGVGKTFSLIALCNRLLHELRPVRFCTGIEILDWYRQCIDDVDPYAEEDLNQRLLEPDIIAWDDIGKEYIASDWALEKFFYLIDGRLRLGKPFAFTSNYKPMELEHKFGHAYGSAIASRIQGACRLLVLEGPDRRLKQ